VNENSDSRFSAGPLYGLIVIGISVLLFEFFTPVAEFFRSRTDASPEYRGDCVYEVLDENVCLGTVFAERPQTLHQLLERFKINLPEGVADQAILVPCGTSITLQKNSARINFAKVQGAHLVCAGKQVDLNSATEKDLTAVPGIGPGLAKKIVLQREKLGGFSSLADLRQVPGVGPKRLDAWAPWLSISKPQMPSEANSREAVPHPIDGRTHRKSVENVSVNMNSSSAVAGSR